MSYIVYREPFTSYGEDQGDGYFVGYKNKVSDKYSKDWFEAHRYKSIGYAINRLGINYNKITNLDHFIKSNKPKNRILRKSFNRSVTLSNILDEEINIETIIKLQGGIYKIVDNKYVIDATDEVVKYLEDKFSESKNKIDRKLSKTKNLSDSSSYIIQTEEGEDFWDGF